MKVVPDLIIPFTWDERRVILMDKFLYIPNHLDYKKETFSFFGDDKPIVVEFCSGNGEWIGEKAKKHPEFNWLAVDKKFERARLIWHKIHREEIGNLEVVCGDALTFTKYYCPRVSRVYVNFPDPWPKLRHAKHRLIREEFLEELLKIIPTGGVVICATDDEPYAKQMLFEFQKSPFWKLLSHEKNLPSYGRSFFNELWVKKGKTIHYISHEKTCLIN